MFCSKCGASIADGSTFCPACGGAQGAAKGAGFQPVVVGGVTFGLYKILMIAAIFFIILGSLVPGVDAGANVSFIETTPGMWLIISAVVALGLHNAGKDKQVYLPMIVALSYIIYITFEMFGKNGPDVHVGYFLVLIGALAATILPYTPIAKEDK